MVKNIESYQEFEYVMNNFHNRLIVLDFTAIWCGPCKRIAPFFEQLGVKYPEVIFYRIDIDDFPEIATELNVSGVPDFKFIVNGKICHQFSGADPNLLEDVVKQLSYKASLLPPKYPESNSNIPNSTQNTSYSMEDRPY